MEGLRQEDLMSKFLIAKKSTHACSDLLIAAAVIFSSSGIDQLHKAQFTNIEQSDDNTFTQKTTASAH